MKRKDLDQEHNTNDDSRRSSKQGKVEANADVCSKQGQIKNDNDNPTCIPIDLTPPNKPHTGCNESSNPNPTRPSQNPYKQLTNNLHLLFSPGMGRGYTAATAPAATQLLQPNQAEKAENKKINLDEQGVNLNQENQTEDVEKKLLEEEPQTNTQDVKHEDCEQKNSQVGKSKEDTVNKIECIKDDFQNQIQDDFQNQISDQENTCANGADCSNVSVENQAGGSINAEAEEKLQEIQQKQDGEVSGEQVQEKKPTAKEEAAAKAARIRLGFEQPTEEDLQQMAQQLVKLPGGEEPTANVDFQYIAADDLSPLEDPQQVSKDIEQLLTTTDWVKMCDHINYLRSLAVFNKDLLTPKLLSKLVPKLIKYIKNPRSSVCKTALICAKDLISCLRDFFVPFMDVGGQKQPASSLLATLLMKASANDKRFVIEATQEALDSVAVCIVPESVLMMILPYSSHKNPKVRGQAGMLLHKSLSRMCPEDILKFGLEKLLKSCGSLVCDKTPEARETARQCIILLKNAYESQSTYEEGNQSSAKTNQDETAQIEEEDDQKENSPVKSNLRAKEQSNSEKQDISERKGSENVDWSQFCAKHVDNSFLQQVLKVG